MNNTITLNKAAWDKEVDNGRNSTLPVSPEQINIARKGSPQICLTTQKIVPQEWLGNLFGKDVLALASGGGNKDLYCQQQEPM